MQGNFARSMPHFLKHEGGYVDNPKDPGGATNKGVTLATFRKYIKPGGSKADLRKITIAQVSMVYKRFYWDMVSADYLPSGLDYCVCDFAINSGWSRAAKYLQAIVGVAQDGRIGPATIAAVEKLDPSELINRLCDDRLAYMKRIRHRKTKQLLWTTFGKGWSRRVSDVRKLSRYILNARPPIEKPTPKPVTRPVPRPEPKPVTKPVAAVEEELRGKSETIRQAEKIKDEGLTDKIVGIGGALSPIVAFFSDYGPYIMGLVIVLGAGWFVWRQIRKDRAADVIIQRRIDDHMTGKHIGRPEIAASWPDVGQGDV